MALTVDDKAVFQSLPTNEKGFHAGSGEGNGTSIGIEICMHPEMNVTAGYDRAALLTAVMAFQLGVSVPSGIKQHNHWTGKDCPSVLRHKPNGWEDFLAEVKSFRNSLEPVPAPVITFMHSEDEEAATRQRARSGARRKAKRSGRTAARGRAAKRMAK
jgi:N-acetylmuramoyl-L-alanine amidase CwlA